MHELSYRLSRGETKITLGKTVKNYLESLPENSLLVFPENISNIVEPNLVGLSFHTFKLKDGEEGKSLDSVVQIIQAMKQADFRRSSTLVSIGGGTTSDAVGMAASMYMRGVNYVSVPTTLLSMVDAALGGKNAVNLNGIKNLLGSFYSPSEVKIDLALISGMPQNLLTDGMGEIAKYALICDPELYQQLGNNDIEEILGDTDALGELILKCVKNKMDIVAEDEFDQLGKRIVLNFGHTLGHSIESATNFSIGHGTAVAYGMLLETQMGMEFGLLDREIVDETAKLLDILHLPSSVDRDFISGLVERMTEVLSSDKKAKRNSIEIPLPVKPGVSEIFEVKLKEIRDYLEKFK